MLQVVHQLSIECEEFYDVQSILQSSKNSIISSSKSSNIRIHYLPDSSSIILHFCSPFGNRRILQISNLLLIPLNVYFTSNQSASSGLCSIDLGVKWSNY